MGRLSEDLLGHQEFCEQGAAMGIRMRASGTLVLCFYMLMQREYVGVVLVELEESFGDIDRPMFVTEGKIRCISFCAKHRIGDGNVCQNELLTPDDIALNRDNQRSNFWMRKSEHIHQFAGIFQDRNAARKISLRWPKR